MSYGETKREEWKKMCFRREHDAKARNYEDVAKSKFLIFNVFMHLNFVSSPTD